MNKTYEEAGDALRIIEIRTDYMTVTPFVQRDRLVGSVRNLIAEPDYAWDCPLGRKDCTSNCGSYGCGN